MSFVAFSSGYRDIFVARRLPPGGVPGITPTVYCTLLASNLLLNALNYYW